VLEPHLELSELRTRVAQLEAAVTELAGVVDEQDEALLALAAARDAALGAVEAARVEARTDRALPAIDVDAAVTAALTIAREEHASALAVLRQEHSAALGLVSKEAADSAAATLASHQTETSSLQAQLDQALSNLRSLQSDWAAEAADAAQNRAITAASLHTASHEAADATARAAELELALEKAHSELVNHQQSFAALQADLRGLQASSSSEIASLRDRLDELTEERDLAAVDRDAASHRALGLAERLQASEAATLAAAATGSDLRASIETMTVAQAATSAQLVAAEVACETLEKQNAALAAQLTAALSEVAELSDRVVVLKVSAAEAIRLSAALSEHEAAMTSKDVELHALESSLAAADTAHHLRQSLLVAEVSRLEQLLQHQERTLESAVASAQTSSATALSQKKQLTATVAALRAASAELSQQVFDLQAQILALAAERDAHKAHADVASDATAASTAKLTALAADVAGLRDQLSRSVPAQDLQRVREDCAKLAAERDAASQRAGLLQQQLAEQLVAAVEVSPVVSDDETVPLLADARSGRRASTTAADRQSRSLIAYRLSTALLAVAFLALLAVDLGKLV
jgi:chromosome segregation ATPase